MEGDASEKVESCIRGSEIPTSIDVVPRSGFSQVQFPETHSLNQSNLVTDSVDFDARRLRNGRAFGSDDSLRPLQGTENHPELPCTRS